MVLRTKNYFFLSKQCWTGRVRNEYALRRVKALGNSLQERLSGLGASCLGTAFKNIEGTIGGRIEVTG